MLLMLLLCREGEAGDVERVVQLDTRCCMTPALRKIRRETHFVKPDGESLMQAINKLDGEEVKLVSTTTHATHNSTIQHHQAVVVNGVALHRRAPAGCAHGDDADMDRYLQLCS